MKKITITLVAATSCFLMGSITPALGSITLELGNSVSSIAVIGWDSFRYTGGSLSFLQNDSMESYSMATTTDTLGIIINDDDYVSGGGGWGNTQAHSAYNLGNSSASGHSQTGATFLQSTSFAAAFFDGDTSEALAEAQRGAIFQVTAGGTLSFSVDYSLTSSADNYEGKSYVTSAGAWSRLYLWNGVWNEFSPALQEISIDSGNTNQLSLSENGALTVTGSFEAGQYGYVAAGTYAESGIIGSAPVPLPASLVLLGSGLLGLVGIRRKKAN